MVKIKETDNKRVFLNMLYCEYRTFMLQIARMYIKDMTICEDVVHTAFITLIRNEERIRSFTPAKIKAYIILAVRHASFDLLQKQRRMNLISLPDNVLTELVSRSIEMKSASITPYNTVELKMIVEQLSEEDQVLLVGHYIVGLNSNELADMLHCTSGALRMKLQRARKRAVELFTSQGLSFTDFLA